MRVLRGRAASPAEDRDVVRTLATDVAASGEPAVRVWSPARHLAFGRRDARAEGYERARAAAAARGFPPVERDVGGRAVAYTGTTLAFIRVDPVDDPRTGLADRYEETMDAVASALAELGVDASEGEPPDAFCPGDHSLSAAGGKVAGLAQRVGRGAARVGGVLVVDGCEEVAAVLEPVYDALDVPFDPGSVGSVERALGEPVDECSESTNERAATGRSREPVDAGRVRQTVERALVGDADPTVETLPEE